VLYIDLNRFKLINDSMGHHIGDELVKLGAGRLLGVVRNSDIVARLGGDEFVVVLTSVDGPLSVAHLADRIVRSLGEPYPIDGISLNTSPSLGVSLYPDDARDADSLMKQADTAMYHAKEQGRNHYQFFTPAMNQAAQQRLSLEQDLRNALQQDQFVLHYQPKVDPASGRISGVEALVRWNHPRDGLMAPDRFISVAEEAGLIGPLGRWVLQEACRQLAIWKTQGHDLEMAVNLSPHQLRDQNLPLEVLEVMQQHGIDPGELELEITESAAMTNAEEAIGLMHQLRQVGVKIAIDDFGTGYSSLAYLKLFPIQTLKLDRTFVSDLEQDPNDAAICEATLKLAHSLQLKVVAEGVESRLQQDFLCQRGCDSLQGYLYSRPLPAEAMESLLLQRFEVSQSDPSKQSSTHPNP
ncbi:MAG: EAL domain-containing protein, partial [Gammaproteobacteria bacterium]|nr:EAL domain-containing protein [Gammaproteobacteria bacterium]